MAAQHHNPLDQFQIHEWIPIKLGHLDFSYTNSAFYMTLIVLGVWFFVAFGMRHRSTVPGRWQSMVEMVYEFIGGMLYDTAGPEARRFFPFVFSLFMFILFANLLGLIPVPHAFTVTSHIIVTFAFALLVFVLVTVTGFVKNGFRFFKIFLPAGVPIWLTPLIIPIEMISYMIRPMSLSVRLFANMMAGHVMLKVLAGFVLSLPLLAAWIPLVSVAALTGLEIVIAILQAYVFAMLTCIYFIDAYHVEH